MVHFPLLFTPTNPEEPMPQPMLAHLRIVSAGPNRYLQHLILDAPTEVPEWRTLRPVRLALTHPHDPIHVVFMGTHDAYDIYDLPTLLAVLVTPSSAFELDDTMPDPLPAPEALHCLDGTTMTVLVRGALGHTTNDIDAYLGVLNATAERPVYLPEIRETWEAAGIQLLKASSCQPFIEAAKAREQEELENNLRKAKHADRVDTLRENLDGDRTASGSMDIPYGTVQKLTPDQLIAFERRLRGDRNARRLKWPFANMAIGDVVRIESDLAIRGQRAAHSYSSASGHLFATTRLRNGDLEVVRISGFRLPRTAKRTM